MQIQYRLRPSFSEGAQISRPSDGIKWADGDAWVQEKCKKKLLKRLAPLDGIEQLQDDERCNEVAWLQKIPYTDCAARRAAGSVPVCGPGTAPYPLWPGA